MELKNSEHGFTLLSNLLAIFIIGLILPFIINLYQATGNSPSYTKEISIQQFFQFLRDDLANSESYDVENERLILTLYDGTPTTIEKYKDLIRRQVEGKGHEIYLRDIKSVLFEKLTYGIKTTITSFEGDKYVKHIVLYP